MSEAPLSELQERIDSALGHGHFDQAAMLLEKAGRATTLSPLQLTQLGYCYTMTGRHEKAEAPFREAAKLAPGSKTFSNLGNLLRLLGEYEEAAQVSGKAVQMDPSNPDARNNLALVYRRLGRHEEAIELLKGLPSRSRDVLLELSINHHLCGQAEKSLEYAIAAYRLAAGDPEVLLQLAISLDANERREEAIRHLETAASIAPQNEEILTRLAHLLELAGRVEACELIRREIERRDIRNALSLHVEARLKFRAKEYEAALEILERVDLGAEEPQIQQQVLTLNGKCLDKLGRYDEAWECFNRSGRVAAAHRANPHLLQLFYAQIERLGESAGQAGHVGASTAAESSRGDFGEPVFLVGLPRSGTTLLGYLMGELEGVSVLDEERLFFDSVLKVLGTNDAEKMLRIDDRQAEAIATHYQALAREKGVPPERLLVDKDPLNLVNVDLIHRIFPGSRFLYLARHPYDVALSIHMQNFADRSVLSQCNTIGQCIEFCNKVLNSWERIALRSKAPIFHLRYEDFVTDPDRHMAAIARWLGTGPTGQGAATPEERLSGIRTPSYLQVSEPVNTRGVGRWRHYRRHLTPEVLAPLRAAAERHDSGESKGEIGS